MSSGCLGESRVAMTGIRGLLRRAFGRDRESRSVSDGGVVVDDSAPDATGASASEGDGYDIAEGDGVNRAEVIAAAGFEQVFDATGVPTFVLDAEGTVAEWSESIASLTGSEREDAIGHEHVSELFYPDGRRADTLADKVLDAPETADEVHGVERCDGAGTRYRDTSTMVDRHGDEKHIEFTASPLYDGDELVGVTDDQEVAVDELITRVERLDAKRARQREREQTQ